MKFSKKKKNEVLADLILYLQKTEIIISLRISFLRESLQFFCFGLFPVPFCCWQPVIRRNLCA